MRIDAVLIAGPTASGKSASALELAERLKGALVNTDSMQVYGEARILTARPGEAALSRAPHQLYGHVSVHEPYSVARYQTDALRVMNDVQNRGMLPVFVGGTGLYFHALTEGLAAIPPVPQAIREKTRARRAEIGAEAFFAEFAARDPGTAARLRASDTQRVSRASEVFEATGRPLLDWQQTRGPVPLAGMRLARFVLSPPRAELHRRIALRFEQMLAAGAIKEAARLTDIDPALPSAKILGLRELLQVRDGVSMLDVAKSAATTATRQYAKRQLTWFRHRMADWDWIETPETDEIVTQMLARIRGRE
ncbi:MAG TPA: tRNA (adenosine(37)-N6)-dimethylallyltransferase MiaA [Rhizomicrobium sp.]|jgi:tRNA dimethylallyltransferase|nr:tRNA (adenosine(37)-N6)-dimethylallyltransferase MiaA [Rhizomicrobium sp.]